MHVQSPGPVVVELRVGGPEAVHVLPGEALAEADDVQGLLELVECEAVRAVLAELEQEVADHALLGVALLV